jgi:hypothetical protein
MGSEYIDESEWFQYEGAYPCLGGGQPVQRRDRLGGKDIQALARALDESA